MDEINFNDITQTLKDAKDKGFAAVTEAGSLTPDIVSKLSMLSLYCDTAVSNINAAATLYSELVKKED